MTPPKEFEGPYESSQKTSQAPHQLVQRKVHKGTLKSRSKKKKKKKKKIVQPSEPKHNKTSLEEYLESIEEYVQKEPTRMVL